MRSLFRRLLLVSSAATLIPSFAGAQSYYADDGFDDSTAYIYGQLIGYPGTGSCSSMSMWNSLNGDMVSGWAPADLLSYTYGVDDVDYLWSFGATIEYSGPDFCNSVTYSVSKLLSLHTTYYQGPILIGDAACEYSTLACTSGTPLCNSSNYLGYQFGSTCPAVIKVGYLVAGGYCTAGLAYDATQQAVRICT